MSDVAMVLTKSKEGFNQSHLPKQKNSSVKECVIKNGTKDETETFFSTSPLDGELQPLPLIVQVSEDKDNNFTSRSSDFEKQGKKKFSLKFLKGYGSLFCISFLASVAYDLGLYSQFLPNGVDLNYWFDLQHNLSSTFLNGRKIDDETIASSRDNEEDLKNWFEFQENDEEDTGGTSDKRVEKGNKEDIMFEDGKTSFFSTLAAASNARTVAELTKEETTVHQMKALWKLDPTERFRILGVNPRAFEHWKYGELPCFPIINNSTDWKDGKAQRTPTHRGWLLVKTPKTASTTAASVTLRIASRIGKSENNNIQNPSSSSSQQSPLCLNRVQHIGAAYKMDYKSRNRNESVLWAFVRDPTKRAVSQYFHFGVSRRGIDPTNSSAFLHFFQSKESYLRSFQVKYLTVRQFQDDNLRLPMTEPAGVINGILNNYDFIGVTERLDESIVAFQMLLGLKAEDVLYFSSLGSNKQSGGWDDGRYQYTCTFIQPSAITPTMKQYFESDVWQYQVIFWDKVLHEVINHSLDLTIQALGPEQFAENLQRFTDLKHKVGTLCDGQVIVPCSGQIHPRSRGSTSCLYDDMGCGFDCMDKVLGNT